MAQEDCTKQDPLNDATRWGMFVSGTNGATTEQSNVADPAAVCDSAMSFRITKVQPRYSDGAFYYGLDGSIPAERGARYRVSFRYRASTLRPVYWRTLTRPVGGSSSQDLGLTQRTLPATTTYQTYTEEFEVPDTLTSPYSLIFVGFMANSTAEVLIDDFKMEILPTVDCEEGPFNDIQFWRTYNGTGTPQELGVIEDPDAVCGNAIYVELKQLENTPFGAAGGIDQSSRIRFEAGSLYRVKFRYRADMPRILYYRMIPTAPTENLDFSEVIYSEDLVATEEYQQFDQIVQNLGLEDKSLVQLWLNGDALTRFYIDDFSAVKITNPDIDDQRCAQEDPFFNNVNNYTTYGGATLTEVKTDSAAICDDAFEIDPGAAADGDVFAAGFEIREAAAYKDVKGGSYSVSFRYRSERPRLLPLIITSRPKGTFGTDDGPRYFFLNLASTTEYQRATVPIESELASDDLNRIMHIMLGVGGDDAKIYIDNLKLEFTPPAVVPPTPPTPSPDSNRVVTIGKLSGELTVDGLADDAYDDAEAYSMSNEVQPGITSSADLSGDWRALWSETGLYVYIDVTDDTLVNDSDLWYRDDGIEIFIDGGNEKADSYDGNDYQLSVQYGVDELVSVSLNGNKLGEGTQAVVADHEGGYAVEAFIPWTALNMTPEVGTRFGMDAQVFDDDLGGDQLNGKLAWMAETDSSYLRPDFFGTIELGDVTVGLRTPVTFGDWLSVYPNPVSGQLRYDIGATRQANLEVRDINGRLMLQQQVSGSNGTLEMGDFPNGIYLLTVSDGKEWARQRLIVQH